MPDGIKKAIAISLALVFAAAGIILVTLSIAGLVNNVDKGTIENIISGAENWTRKKVTQTLNGLAAISSEGKLIGEESVKSLLGSGITGDNFIFDTTYYPYYSFLSESEKKIYAQAYANAIAYETAFLAAESVTTDSAERALNALLYDHPELFWLDTSYQYSYLSNNICIQINLQFNMDKSQIPSARTVFDSTVDNIMERAELLGSDYEKEKYVHDTIISIANYREESEINQSAFSALVYGSSVCAGYSKAFQYIMCRLGIPTFYVTGYSEGNHAWNIVCLNGGYYNVDLTWDDSEPVSYIYFNRSDSELAETHSRDNMSLILPVCDATEFKGNGW